jgi:hypothetical protein
MLSFARGFDWPADAPALRGADLAVEAAAPSLMTRTDRVVRALASYPPSIRGAGTRDLLWQAASRSWLSRARRTCAARKTGAAYCRSYTMTF